MLFKKEHIEPILNGNKTQTRRVWKKRKALPGKIHLAKTEMLKTRYFAKLKITKVYMEKIGDISDSDSVKEGYKNRSEYLDKFYEINKKSLKKMNTDWKELMVYVVEWEFPLVENNYIEYINMKDE